MVLSAVALVGLAALAVAVLSTSLNPARKGPGPPFAVLRIARPSFPLAYRLGPGDVMTAGTPFEGEVDVSARLSRAAAAAPAGRGDLEGEHPGRVTVGARGVDIVISHVRCWRRPWGRDARRCGVTDLKKVRRSLLDLKMTENFLRQYPQLAAKVAAALEKAGGQKG
ncbi:MAG: hypothetical protein HY803_01050 [candidate division NC10 bacterium]|nr:hypothetical protein [candidate division NC10 bacterium]